MSETISLTTKIERDDLILILADRTGLSTKTVSILYDELGSVLKEQIESANELHNVSVVPYDWISINSCYQSKKTKTNNFTGELITVPNKIKPKAVFTRSFLDSLIK